MSDRPMGPLSEVELATKDESTPPGSVVIEVVAAPPAINIPDGGLQAWLSVLGGFLICTTTFGYSNSFGVFQDYYVLSGASSASNISWIGSLQLFFMFVVGLPAGKLFDQGYFHYVVGSGSILYVFCLFSEDYVLIIRELGSMFMLSLANPHKYYQLVLSQGIGMGIGSGLMLVPAMSVQTHHWRVRRSLAMGIVMTGSGVGGLIYPIMLNKLVNGSAGFAWGVRATAFLTLGLLAIANAVMTTRLPSARKRGPGPKPDMKAIMTDGPYWLFAFGLFLVLWGMFFPYFYLQLWVNLHRLSGTLAFYTIAILNAASIFGRTLPNMLADRVGPFNVLAPVAVITSALVLAMFGVTSTGAVIVFSILYGFFSGAMISLMPPAAATLAKGLHEIGIRLGLGYFVTSFAMLTGTPIAGALFDEGGRWYKPIVFNSAFPYLCRFCHLLRVPRRMRNWHINQRDHICHLDMRTHAPGPRTAGDLCSYCAYCERDTPHRPEIASEIAVRMFSNKSPPIAIVGIAAELPSGDWSESNLDYNSFYDFLLQGGEAYEKMPADRFNMHTLKGTASGQVGADTGAFLKDIGLFDPIEFGITSKDARLMSLGTRKLIETTFLALLDSSIDYRGRDVGCYMSAVAHDMFSVSGHLNLICHPLGVQALRNGECEAAVVGAVSSTTVSMHRDILLESDRTFDLYCVDSGEVRPLDAALRDRDRIYATILGTASILPARWPRECTSRIGAENAMLRAFAQAQRSPREIDFVELHATGTASGDPTEANWVGVQFGRDDELLVGSVKGNIGHTEITAFLSSLCKWTEHNMRVPVTPEKLSIRSPSGRALIAMSSSGIGGANGHCVIEAHAPDVDGTPQLWAYQSSVIPSLLIIGGLSPRSASAVGESLKALTAEQDHKDMDRALGRRARSMLWKAYAVTPDGQTPRFSEPALTPKTAPEIVFVFPGRAPTLEQTCVPFHDTVVELDAVYASVTGKSLIADVGLFGESDVPDTLGDVWPISITLPALTILQIALMEALAFIGVKPDVVIGHSAGETAVVYASGAAFKAMAVELSIARGRAMEALEGHDGAMAAVACSAALAEETIVDVVAELGPAALEVGCYNAPNAITLSGSAKHIASAVARAKAAGILATQLRTRIPVHSSMMAICQADYEERVGEVFKKYAVVPTKVETFSSLTGGILNTPYDARYFWDNTLGPVMFEPAINAIHTRHPQSIFVELGPHPVLSGYITAISGHGTTVLSPMKRSRTAGVGEPMQLLDCVGRLVCAGYSRVNMDVLFGMAENASANIPPYPFARKETDASWPIELPSTANQHTDASWLADHIIQNEPIMPAAGFLEMALEFGAKKLWNIQFHSVLSLSSERPTPIDVRLEDSQWSVHSAPAADLSIRGHRQKFTFLGSTIVYMRQAISRWKRTRWRCVSSGHQRHTCTPEDDGDEEFYDNLRSLPTTGPHAALQVAVHPLITGAVAHGHYYLPSKLGTLVIHDALAQGMPEKIYAHAVLSNGCLLMNERGQTLCTIDALEVAAHGRTPLIVQHRYDMAHRQLDIHLSISSESGDNGSNMKTTMIVDGESLCFIASKGVLRHFPATWPLGEYEETAQSLCAHPLAEEEMSVHEDGSVRAPMVVSSPAPRKLVSFDPGALWTYQHSTLSQVSHPMVPPGHVLIQRPLASGGRMHLVTHSDTGSGAFCASYTRAADCTCTLAVAGRHLGDQERTISAAEYMVSGREERMPATSTGRCTGCNQQALGSENSGRGPVGYRDALKLALSNPTSFTEVFTPPIDALDIVRPTDVCFVDTIFAPDKNGAREIVLTSRSGTAKLATKDEFIALRLLAYLRSRDDLVLRTEAIDASSVEETRELVASSQKPFGGCMIMTTNLIDRTFATQTSDTFEASFTAKLGAFHALEKVIDIHSLDFVLAFSSVAGLLGNAGQTNYASANTALTGLTKRYKNAATIVPPMINDTGGSLTLAATDTLCECIGDALLKLREGPVWQYIPDCDWSLVQSKNGSSPLYDHLVVKESLSDTDHNSEDLERELGDIICDVLDIDHEDLSPDVPLTSYGLDSLSAMALSHALEPYLAVSQLQLLADVTLADLEQLREESLSATTPDPESAGVMAEMGDC
ncbi:uncharacterized protein B0H18DRAFT_954918 [Fomitopsis serialis]|uniref:uncharacterized protein n=1 Tax=Fomitopsis serialis TaxID=139415 RepID=UPI0020078F70|nr:uncharacterized protein B0H18DRAFT_954918 [Neoantrodia serialis]KAH9926041.1 hypothetical protein B0H18DRAFT_954918 [Neoantrodia serialis]